MIKTAVIGASGYIGQHLFHHYRKTFNDCIGTSFSNAHSDLCFFDLRNPQSDNLKLVDTDHRAVIIASAKPNIAWCEAYPKESYELNVMGTLKLIQQLEKQNIHVMFFSSDYVFDGKKGDYHDKAEPSPNTEYGRQKAEVERELPNITQNFTILRLSKIYGTTWKDNSLIDNLAADLSAQRTIKVADDQFFSPTHVDDVVLMTTYIQEQKIKGLINLCHSNCYSRYQIAHKLCKKMNIKPNLIERISLHDLKGMENRPLNTSLVCSSILNELQIKFWRMQDAIDRVALNWASKKG